MNASSPAARVRRGGALALLGVLTIALFTALLALTPTTPDASAAAADGCDEVRISANAADGCVDDCGSSFTAFAGCDPCDDYDVGFGAVRSDCVTPPPVIVIEENPSPTPVPPTPVPPTSVPTTAPTVAPTSAPVRANPTATPQPPPPPIIGPIVPGPIVGNFSAELDGDQLTIDVPGHLSVQLQPAVFINAGGDFHAGPLPANGEVVLTVRPGTGPITIVLKGTVWTGAPYRETLVVPR